MDYQDSSRSVAVNVALLIEAYGKKTNMSHDFGGLHGVVCRDNETERNHQTIRHMAIRSYTSPSHSIYLVQQLPAIAVAEMMRTNQSEA